MNQNVLADHTNKSDISKFIFTKRDILNDAWKNKRRYCECEHKSDQSNKYLVNNTKIK